MKQLAKSLAQNGYPIQFGVGIEIQENGIRFYTFDADKKTIDSRLFDFASKPLALKELAARDNIYVVADASGYLEPFYNKMAASSTIKSSGYDHARKKNKHVIGQIYIPFADASIADCSARITYSEEGGYESNVAIERDVEDFGAFFNEVSPTLKADVVPSGIRVQIVDASENAIAKAGVKIYAKTDGGQLVFNERITDSTGTAVFKLLTPGFEQGDEATVEFGFKWVSNLAQVKVGA